MKVGPMNLIEGTNLRKTYRLSRHTSVEALRGVDVGIAAGEMVAIMGPSGSGKSTLMHVLGLLHSPDSEDGPAPGLRINGVDATTMSDRERTGVRARSMGFVFQSFNLVPTLTAEENVALAAEYAGTSRGKQEPSNAMPAGCQSPSSSCVATGLPTARSRTRPSSSGV